MARSIFLFILFSFAYSDSLSDIYDGFKNPPPSFYHTYDEIIDKLLELDQEYGSTANSNAIYQDLNPGIIFQLDTIGYSTNLNLPIFSVKISDNANIEEDEPRILILGSCHAEEIYGVEISMRIIDMLLDPMSYVSYIQDLRSAISESEIYIVPTYNPEGHRVVHGYYNGADTIRDNSYRKNITDVNDNQVFDFDNTVQAGNDIDGVDLNRNYDFNWFFGDDKNTMALQSCNASYISNFDYYRGAEPFSEKETQAVRSLALEKQFLLSVAYHSSRSGCVSEKIIFPWKWEEVKPSPDFEVAHNLASSISSFIPKEVDVGFYDVTESKSRKGNAHDWFYSQTGCIQYLIEAGTEIIQSTDSTHVEDTIDRNIKGLIHVLNRTSGYGSGDFGAIKAQIIGKVTDPSGNPVIAEVKILELDGPMLKKRLTDTDFGRYRRLLVEDSYTLEISAYGYKKHSHSFTAAESSIYEHDVVLEPLNSRTLSLNILTPDGFDEDMLLYLDTGFGIDTLNVISGYNSYEVFEGSYSGWIQSNNTLPMNFEVELSEDKLVELTAKWPQVLSTSLEIVDVDAIDSYWVIENEVLLSQPNITYLNDISSSFQSSSFTLYADQVNILRLEVGFEVEWEEDNFNVFLVSSEGNEALVSSQSGHSWDYSTSNYLLSPEEDGDYSLRFELSSDMSVNYRGVKINSIEVLSSTEGDCYKADTDLDSKVDVNDVLIVVNEILELHDESGFIRCSSDVFEDSEIDVLDVIAIIWGYILND